MRTNIVIDPALMAAAMAAGPYRTKKEAVEAGLKLLARQAAYRKVLALKGRLKWDAEPWDDLGAHVEPEATDLADGARAAAQPEPTSESAMVAQDRTAAYGSAADAEGLTDDETGTSPHAGR